MVRKELIGQSAAMVRAAKKKVRLEAMQKVPRRGMGPPPAVVAKKMAFRMPPSWYDRTVPVAMKNYFKPYGMLMRFSNRCVSAQVFDERTKELVASASSREAAFRRGDGDGDGVGDGDGDGVGNGDGDGVSLCNAAAAARVGKALGERLLGKGIPGVTFMLRKGEHYHGRRKAFLDSLRDTGIKFV